MIYSKKICLIDTCIIIDIISSKELSNIFFNTLKFEGYQIIIPKLVEKEFINNKPKNKYQYNKLKNKYQLDTCDITNNIKELSKLPIDTGEADAFLQIEKMKRKNNFELNILFITNDKEAINYFQKSSIQVKTSKDFLIKI